MALVGPFFYYQTTLVQVALSGLSSTVFWALNIPVSYTYFVLNAILLTVALKTLGWRFCVKTIYGVLVMTFATGFLRGYFPHPTIMHEQPFVAMLIGSLFCGMGMNSLVEQILGCKSSNSQSVYVISVLKSKRYFHFLSKNGRMSSW